MQEVKIRKLTLAQRKRMERNEKIRKEYGSLVTDESQSRMEIMRYLMKKYAVYSYQGLYNILNQKGA